MSVGCAQHRVTVTQIILVRWDHRVYTGDPILHGDPFDDKAQELLTKLKGFMDQHIYPNEKAYAEQVHNAENRFAVMPLMDELKEKAKAEGLWNLFVPEEYGQYSDIGGLSFLDYAPLCEKMADTAAQRRHSLLLCDD